MKKTPILLMLLALLILAAFSIYPVFNAFRLSLFDMGLLQREVTFVGLKNYSVLLSDPLFYNSLKATLLFAGGSVAIQYFLGLFLATLLSTQDLKGIRFFRSSFILPYTLSELVVALVWLHIYDSNFGVLNGFVNALGVPVQRWLFDWAMPAVIVANCWWGSTFSMLLLESAMKGIPAELYEAAKVDGASGLQQFFKITLPSLHYVSMLNLIMITLLTINAFGIVFVLTFGGPQNATDVIGMYMWRNAFRFMDLGYGATLAVVIFIFNIIITLLYIRVFGKETLKGSVSK
ncbi:MAG: sugar ABC transporter permease [Spirochaetes bacterium]|nr:MAG: sugar ABC transporter permease [Spirochaetota bacterium]